MTDRVRESCDLLCLDLPRAEAIRARLPGEQRFALGAARGRAAAEPRRLRVAAALTEAEELCGCDLAWITGYSEQLISHHVSALRKAELVESRRAGKIVFHSLTQAGRRLLEMLLTADEART